MRTIPSSNGRRFLLLGALITLAMWAVGVHARDPQKPMPLGEPRRTTLPVNTDAPAKPAEKLLTFEFRDKPWISVLEWLADQSGLPVSADVKPTGTFTFIAPQPLVKYTLAQVIDMLNEALVRQKYILIRRDQSFTIVPADEKIDPSILPRILLEDLDKRGNTEMVQVVLPLKSLLADTAAGEVKRMMGPFGEVVALEQANQLLLTDTAGNLKRIHKIISDIENADNKQATYSHTCKFITARDAEKALKELLGDKLAEARALQPAPQFDPRFRAYDPTTGQPMPIQRAQPQPLAANLKIRPHYISVDERNNTVLVTGPADKLALAAEIMKKIDVPRQGNPPELITLNTLEASKVVDTLKGIFGSDTKTGAPYLEADSGRNAIIVKGTLDQVADIKATLKALGEGIPGGSGTLRIITIEKASAATIAEALQRMLPQMRENPVKVIVPGVEEPKKPEPPRPERPSSNGKPGSCGEEQDEPKPAGQPLVDPQQPPVSQQPKAGNKNAPINITAVGNKLIVTSDDPEALALTQQLVRLLTQTPGSDGDFEVIRLKNANAADAAKILDEAFNGTKQQPNQQQNFPFGPVIRPYGGGPGGQPVLPPPANPVRIVADPATNSLLVRASPIDMVRVRRLIRDAIDIEDTESKAVMKSWVLPLKYANATEIASVIRDVYREHVNNSAVTPGAGGIPGFGFGRSRSPTFVQNVDANGNPRGVSLSIGVDERSNRLLLNCSAALHKDIKTLVDQLDDAAKDATKTVRIVSLKGIDPSLVQQAVDAIQGRRTNFRSGADSGFGSPGFAGFRGSGFGPSGMGGFRSFQNGFSPGSFSPGGTSPGGLTPGAIIVPRSGGPPGGGGSSSSGSRQSSRGPDFFDYRVKDDPEPSVLYDPQQDASTVTQAAFQDTNAEQQPPAQQPPQPPPPASGQIQGPRLPVTVEALPELGSIVVYGDPADVERILGLIKFLQEQGAGAEVQIHLVPLAHADATSVSNILTQLYQRVVVRPGGNVQSLAPGAATPTTTPFGAPATTQQQLAGSVVLIPVPRFNAILLAAPKARVDDITKEIRRLDRPTDPLGKAVPFPLRKASAARVASLLNAFYAGRYPTEGQTQNQIRITYDDSINTVFVQAAPADLEEIRGLITRIDTTVSSAVNELRIVPLKNALSDDLATLLIQSMSQAIVAPTTPTTPGGVPPLGGPPGAPRAPGTPLGTVPTTPGVPTAPVAGSPSQSTSSSKTVTLTFVRPGVPGRIEAGALEDVHITSDARTNSLIIAAPAQTMELILALIKELDIPPRFQAAIKVFALRRADATATATLLQQLFLGTGAGPGGPGAPGVPGPTGTTGPATTGTPSAASGIPRPVYGTEGAPLIPLSITVDQRTNSVIVAGGPNEVNLIDIIIARLESSDVEPRQFEVFHLHNASAPDVAVALQTFLTNALAVEQKANQLNYNKELEQDVVIVPEPITNKLLISASPRFFAEVHRLIQELDTPPPQVVIQALIAEVDFNASEEFGVELGLQTPVLFQRGLLPIGTVVNGTTAIGTPGFNFNSTGALGNSSFAGPGIVGFQGLGNLGVGRVSPTSNVGGFVFSAANDTFNLLIRALKTQGRLDVLSRPQITTLDNQSASINIGQNLPIISSSSVTSTGLVTNSIERLQVGVNLSVVPRINPDGTVLMRVIPEVSSVISTMVQLGNGVFGTSYNQQIVQTTVLAGDGETVAIGGLISKQDRKSENKIPWVGDLPYVGALFRFRTQTKMKTELLVILTPHIVRTKADADRILADESRRIDWILGDVVKTHGTAGMEPIFPLPLPGHGPDAHPVPDPSAPLPGVCPAQPSTSQTMPMPAPGLPPSSRSQAPAGAATLAPVQSANCAPAVSTGTVTAASSPPVQSAQMAPTAGQFSGEWSAAPPEPPKEKREWNPFRRKQ